jgi:hypothetical protein
VGTIERTCGVIDAIMRGAVFERNALARAHGMTVAAADRYIRSLQVVPGVTARKAGRKLFLSFSFGAALTRIGR